MQQNGGYNRDITIKQKVSTSVLTFIIWLTNNSLI